MKSKLLPGRFELVFDRQTSPNAYYVAVFTSCSDGVGHCTVYVGVSRMEEDTIQDASEHTRLIEILLYFSCRCPGNVVTIVEGDNCATNRSISNSVDFLHIGCVSRGFQLAVKDILAEYENVIFQIHSIMTKLHTSLMSAKLRQHTFYKATLRNVTR